MGKCLVIDSTGNAKNYANLLIVDSTTEAYFPSEDIWDQRLLGKVVILIVPCLLTRNASLNACLALHDFPLAEKKTARLEFAEFVERIQIIYSWFSEKWTRILWFSGQSKFALVFHYVVAVRGKNSFDELPIY